MPVRTTGLPVGAIPNKVAGISPARHLARHHFVAFTDLIGDSEVQFRERAPAKTGKLLGALTRWGQAGREAMVDQIGAEQLVESGQALLVPTFVDTVTDQGLVRVDGHRVLPSAAPAQPLAWKIAQQHLVLAIAFLLVAPVSVRRADHRDTQRERNANATLSTTPPSWAYAACISPGAPTNGTGVSRCRSSVIGGGLTKEELAERAEVS
jgi:hypothetical protein